MKRIVALLCSLVLFVVFVFTFNSILENKNKKLYTDYVAFSYGNTTKNQGLFLQEQGINTSTNVMTYGSSELGTTELAQNPVNFFPNQGNKFIINLVGRGYCQDLQHAINFGATSKELSGKKVVFIVSMQWFMSKGGVSSADFAMNFSPLQFYSFMFNSSLSKDEKMYAAERINSLTYSNKQFNQERLYARLYSSNNIYLKTVYYALKPYYYFRYEALKTKDNINTYKFLTKYFKGKPKKYNFENLKTVDYNDEFSKAEEEGKKEANRNDYYIKDAYFDKYYRNCINSLKNYDSNANATDSKEYDDIKLLLNICEGQNIKPLFIIMPVNGRWYDYLGINKDIRQSYYSKVENIINSYNFEAADYSKYEYEPYLMQDGMHLGWKGWLYVDQTISDFIK